MLSKRKKINDEIRARKVQLITEQGENLGEMSFSEARKIAEEKELDLMEMGKKGDISIVKMLDYGKYLYKLKKQDKKNKQRGKNPDMKTIRITFKMGEHDIETRLKQVEKFFNGGHPLKVVLILRGRENYYSDLALEKVKKFLGKIEDFYKLDGGVKKNGNTFSAILKIKK